LAAIKTSSSMTSVVRIGKSPLNIYIRHHKSDA
jgi:hypothetical protein